MQANGQNKKQAPLLLKVKKHALYLFATSNILLFYKTAPPNRGSLMAFCGKKMKNHRCLT